MADYRVEEGSLIVTPKQLTYPSDVDAIINIKCNVQRRGSGISAWFVWQSDYSAYDQHGNLLNSDSKPHSVSPFTEIDTGVDDFDLNLGRIPVGTLVGEVVVSAHG